MRQLVHELARERRHEHRDEHDDGGEARSHLGVKAELGLQEGVVVRVHDADRAGAEQEEHGSQNPYPAVLEEPAAVFERAVDRHDAACAGRHLVRNGKQHKRHDADGCREEERELVAERSRHHGNGVEREHAADRNPSRPEAKRHAALLDGEPHGDARRSSHADEPYAHALEQTPREQYIHTRRHATDYGTRGKACHGQDDDVSQADLPDDEGGRKRENHADDGNRAHQCSKHHSIEFAAKGGEQPRSKRRNLELAIGSAHAREPDREQDGPGTRRHFLLQRELSSSYT